MKCIAVEDLSGFTDADEIFAENEICGMFFKNTTDPMAVVSSGVIVYMNRSCLEMLGLCSVSEYLGHSPLEWLCNQTSNKKMDFHKRMESVLGLNDWVTLGCRLKSGSEIDVDVIIHPWIHDGKLFDILSLRKNANYKNSDDAWIKDKNILQMIAGKLDFGFYVFDYSVYKYVYVNNAMENLFGVSFQKINERKETLLDTIHEEDKEILKKQWTLKFINTVEFRIVNNNNEIRWYRSHRQTGKCSGKAPGIVIGAIFDITDAKKNEIREQTYSCQILNADRISHLGRLAGDIVHEINNINSLTTLSAPVLKRAWENILSLNNGNNLKIANIGFDEFNEKMNRLIDSISSKSLKMHKVLKELKTYIKMDDYSISKPIDLNDILRSSISLMEPMISKVSRNFEFLPCQETLVVRGHYQRLEQVFINLLHNACDAMRSRNDRIRIKSKLTSDNMIEISVEDSGCGITTENMAKIGTPFFTTKGNGRMGLGLSVSKEIINEHRGRMQIESVPDSGTVIRIMFCRESNID